MDTFKALHGRRCRSPIVWFEVDEISLINLDLVHEAIEKNRLIRERLKMTQRKCHMPTWEEEILSLIFMIGFTWKFHLCRVSWDLVRNGSLVPIMYAHIKFWGVFDKVSYELDFPNELASVHPIFYVYVEEMCWWSYIHSSLRMFGSLG